MTIRVDIQRNEDLDAGIDHSPAAWFDSVPRIGEIVQFRYGIDNVLAARKVVGVNYVECEPDHFRVLIVVE